MHRTGNRRRHAAPSAHCQRVPVLRSFSSSAKWFRAPATPTARRTIASSRSATSAGSLESYAPARCARIKQDKRGQSLHGFNPRMEPAIRTPPAGRKPGALNSSSTPRPHSLDERQKAALQEIKRRGHRVMCPAQQRESAPVGVSSEGSTVCKARVALLLVLTATGRREKNP